MIPQSCYLKPAGLDKRQLRNDTLAKCAFGRDPELRSNSGKSGLDQSQANRCVGQNRRDCAAGDPADLILLIIDNRRSGDRQRIFPHLDADNPAGDLAARVHPCDNFLTEIAALGEAHGPLKLSRFRGQNRVVEINSKQRAAGFDAGRVKYRPAGWANLALSRLAGRKCG